MTFEMRYAMSPSTLYTRKTSYKP